MISMVKTEGPVCYYYFHLKVTCYEMWFNSEFS